MAGKPDPKPERQEKRPRRGTGIKRGSSHYAWKGSAARDESKRARAAVRAIEGPCESCGAPDAERFRRDGSLDNDAPENVGLLCRSCKMRHDGRLKALASQARRAGRAKGRSGKTLTCPICGAKFYVKPSHALRRKYCSPSCRGVAARDPLPVRKAKRAARHIPGWSVRAKGETACRNCGSTRGLHLHHIIPRGLWKSGRADLRNGITLCADCHLGWHDRRCPISLSLLRDDELAFVRTAEIGQNIEVWLENHYVIGVS